MDALIFGGKVGKTFKIFYREIFFANILHKFLQIPLDYFTVQKWFIASNTKHWLHVLGESNLVLYQGQARTMCVLPRRQVFALQLLKAYENPHLQNCIP